MLWRCQPPGVAHDPAPAEFVLVHFCCHEGATTQIWATSECTQIVSEYVGWAELSRIIVKASISLVYNISSSILRIGSPHTCFCMCMHSWESPISELWMRDDNAAHADTAPSDANHQAGAGQGHWDSHLIYRQGVSWRRQLSTASKDQLKLLPPGLEYI